MRLAKWIAIVVFVILLSSAAFFTLELRPAGSSSDKKEVVVEEGESRSTIANELADTGLVKNGTVFLLYARLVKLTVLPGTYELSPSSSATQIASDLSNGHFKTVKITIPEGWRATDMEDYLVNNRKLPQLKGFALVAQKDEGHLFPDTYELKVDTTIPEVITLMKDNYVKRTNGLNVTDDVLIMASIVEREAASDSDRAPIAGVYVNRLRIGMKLEADPTIQYAKGSWKSVTLDDYKNVISPYNTYLNPGLPPGPICNPGLASIKAALTPEKNDYLFFFHAKGQTYFSKTLQEHQTKVKQYF